MANGKHAVKGDLTGNPFQPQGRHEVGIALIPLGGRKRVIGNQIHLVGNAEESEGADRVDKWSKL